MDNKEIVIKYISQLITVADELVIRVDAPEKIPDTCYRGDISRWNFGYFLSRREKLGGDALALSDYDTLIRLIEKYFGQNSEQLAVYNRAMAICHSHRTVYDLEIKDM